MSSSPPPSPQPEAVLSQLQAVGHEYLQRKPGTREQLMSLCYALIAELQLPAEAIERMGMAEPAKLADVRIAVELNIFPLLKESGSKGVSCEAIASSVGADPVLISRIMRHLAAMKVVSDVEAGTYAATPFSNSLTETIYRDYVIYQHDLLGPTYNCFLEYLKGIDFANPTDGSNAAFQRAHKTQEHFFSWLGRHPEYEQVFHSSMQAYHHPGKPTWTDPGFYPVEERLVNGFDPSVSDVFLVDMGGSTGHDLRQLVARYPSLPGRLLLQDRPEVVADVRTVDGPFEAVAHDIFTPQTVKGARAYFLHSVLHDWGDDESIKILEQLRPALERGYSKVLLHEFVVPRRNAPWPITATDQMLLVAGAVKERTEDEWERLLLSAGFKITQIHSCGLLEQESLIEAELA